MRGDPIFTQSLIRQSRSKGCCLWRRFKKNGPQSRDQYSSLHEPLSMHFNTYF